jgi:serine protease Do
MKAITIKYLLAIFILVPIIALGTGCNLLSGTNGETTTSPTVTGTGTPINPTWTYPGPVSPGPTLTSFVEVVEKVRPSVVVIETDIAAGSGWIIGTDGIIVTNYHVIEDAADIFVILDDGRAFAAESVCSDSTTDIAIIYIDVGNLPAADVSDCCELKVGQLVAAIGNALGLGISLKGGWISRLNTSAMVEDQILFGLIETDAAVNPGNSGGPLVNMAGEVIGITSVKLVDVDIEGVGYAISMDTALPVIQDLITLGYVVRPFLGIQGMTVDYAVAALYNLEVDRGVLIASITPGNPADEAGLEIDDVIAAIDDEETNSLEELVQVIRSKDVGQEIKITYWRGNSQNVTYATLIESPSAN